MKKGLFSYWRQYSFSLSAGRPTPFMKQFPAETQATLPGPDAVKLYEYIMKSNPYTDWQLFPGKGRMYEGKQPHGAFSDYIRE